jgi:hypothetical protein
MSASEYKDIEAHDGHPVGIKVLVDFSPQEAQRVTELAEQAGIPLTQYLKRLVEEAAAARAH